MLAGCNNVQPVQSVNFNQLLIVLTGNNYHVNLTLVGRESLPEVYKISNESIIRYLIAKSEDPKYPDEFVFIEAKPEAVESTKMAMTIYFEALVESTEADAKLLIENRLEFTSGNYLIYIISQQPKNLYPLVEEYFTQAKASQS